MNSINLTQFYLTIKISSTHTFQSVNVIDSIQQCKCISNAKDKSHPSIPNNGSKAFIPIYTILLQIKAKAKLTDLPHIPTKENVYSTSS